MTGLGWIAATITGTLAGWVAEQIMDADHGILMNIALGIGGALVLNALLFAVLGGTLGGWGGQLVVGAIGACILIAGFRAVRGRA